MEGEGRGGVGRWRVRGGEGMEGGERRGRLQDTVPTSDTIIYRKGPTSITVELH